MNTTNSGNDRNVVISGVTIENNTLTDNTESAILVYSEPALAPGSNSVSGVTIEGNTIISHAAALTAGTFNLIDLRNLSGTNTVSDNSVTISGTLPSQTTAVRAIGIRGSQTGTIDITGNTLNGGGVTANGPTPIPVPVTGLLIQSTDSTTGALSAGAVIDVSNNIITGFQNGITVRDSVNAVYGGLAAGVQVNITDNNLAGNSGYALESGNSGQTINATGNWWGVNSDTGVNGEVTGNVNYSPWLDESTNLVTEGQLGFEGDFSALDVGTGGANAVPFNGRINQAIGMLTSGGTIQVYSGTYAENVVITKPLTLEVASGASVTISDGKSPRVPCRHGRGDRRKRRQRGDYLGLHHPRRQCRLGSGRRGHPRHSKQQHFPGF